MRTLAPLAGLLGGLAWIAAFALDETDRTGVSDVVDVVGLVLLLFAAAAAGGSLVTRTTTWLRAIVGICFALLVWSVVQLVATGGDVALVHAVVGVAAALTAVAALSRRPEPADEEPGRRPRGAHAR